MPRFKNTRQLPAVLEHGQPVAPGEIVTLDELAPGDAGKLVPVPDHDTPKDTFPAPESPGHEGADGEQSSAETSGSNETEKTTKARSRRATHKEG